MTDPDPRTVEDIVAAGSIALRRSRRDVADAARIAAIEAAERWLIEQAKQLREAR